MWPNSRASDGEYAHAVELALLRHELNQPLACLSMSIGILRHRIDRVGKGASIPEADLLCVLSAAEEGLNHMRDLIRGIGGTGATDVELVDLADLVSKTLRIAENSVAHDAELTEELETSAVVRACPTRLRQVLLNLVTNAIHAVRDRPQGRGRVTVRVMRAADRTVAFEVSDNGCGMPADRVGRMGELFFTTRPGHGSGIGLALCRGIVQSYGGVLTIRTAESQGTTARVVLPVASWSSNAAASADVFG